MKRLVCRLALLLVLALSTVSMAQVTISVSHPHGPPSSDALQMVVDRFNELYSDIQVVLEHVPGGTTQDELAVRVTAGVAPDVIVLADLVLVEWAGSGALVQLDPYMERDGFSMDQFWPSSTAAVTWLGKTWALPHTQDARALFVNKDDFAEAGLDDRGPRVLADLEAYHRTLTRRTADGTFEHVGIVPWTIQGWFYTWGWLFGAEFIDPTGTKVTPDHPKAVEAMEWLQEFSLRYPPAQIDGLASMWNGTSSMMVHGVWGLGEWKQNFGHVNLGVVPLPPPEGAGPSTWSGIWTMAITSASQHKEEAWEFLKFAASVEGQQMYVEAAANIAANSEAAFASLDVLSDVFGDDLRVFLDLMPYSRSRPTMPAGGVYWNELHRAMTSVINQQATPQAALEEARRVTQQALDEFMAAMEQ